jgi:FtsX-like permease family
VPWAGRRVVNLVAVYWRSVLGRAWRPALVLSLLGGLLGGIALGALAGARTTASAYDRYLRASNASDVLVDIPGTLPGVSYARIIALIAGQPGVVSHAAFMGLNAFPVVHGHIDDSFLTDDVHGSVDGDFFRQDRIVTSAGQLPRLDSTTAIVLDPDLARLFGVGVGGRVTYAFVYYPEGKPVYQFRSYTVAAIGESPPVLIDQADKSAAATLPPGAVAPLLRDYSGYGWVALRLERGTAGIPDLQRHLAALAASLEHESNATGLSFEVQRTDLIHDHVQQSIKPEAVALTIFGAIAAAALLVLVIQGLFQLTSRYAPDARTLRDLGATQRQVTGAVCLPGLIPVVSVPVVAGIVAVALSPLAPVGPVRAYDPARGVHADALVLGAGLPALLLLVLAALMVVAARSTRRAAAGQAPAAARPAPALRRLAAPAAMGVRNALGTGPGQQSVPALITVAGSVVAVTAMVAAVVFSASLTSLTSHPARYGWNWDLFVQAEGSWGTFHPGKMTGLVAGQPAVAGWSELAFAQLPVDGRILPVVGLLRHAGTVEPPTTSGQPLSGPDQVELGAATLAELGKKVGDTVLVGAAPFTRTLRVTGTVTLPSIGVADTDHVSLGRGALLPEATLLAAAGAASSSSSAASGEFAQPVYPSVAVIDLKPGTTAQQRAALVHRITSADPDGVPGGTYQLPPMQASEVYNAAQLGSQPVALAGGLALAAVLSLAMTVLSLVRRRRPEFALLKALGMTRREIRAVVAWQTSLTLVIALVAGVPLGIALGRLAWQDFATSLGVVPAAAVPAALLAGAAALLLLSGNLLAALPAAVAARTRAALFLKAE